MTNTNRIERVAILALLLAALLACATTSATDLAKDRAMAEFDCPRRQLRVKFLSYGPGDYDIYKVEGCGVIATYACSEEQGTCFKESDDRRSHE